MVSSSTNLAIVDDNALFRRALKSYLSEQQHLRVVIQSPDIGNLFNKLREYVVDVLLINAFFREFADNNTLRSIRSEFPNIKIVVLSMSRDMDEISDLLDSGIFGYISKTDEPEDLLQAINAASEGRIYRNRLFTEALYWNKQNRGRSAGDNPDVNLSERDKKMLQLIWEEKSNKEIAEELFLGVRSVEKIRQDLKEKIGVRSTVGMLKYAISKKIIGRDFSIRTI